MQGQNIGIYGDLCQSLYDKLMSSNEDTVKLLRVLSELFARAAEICKDLAIAHASINSPELTNLFYTLRWPALCQSEIFFNCLEIKQSKLGSYFRYFKEEVATIKEAHAALDAKVKDYAKKELRLAVKKDKLYMENNPKAWNIKMEDRQKYTPKQFA